MAPVASSRAGMNGAFPSRRSEGRSGPGWHAAPSARKIETLRTSRPGSTTSTGTALFGMRRAPMPDRICTPRALPRMPSLR
jgi:hypothetical protein